MKLKERKMLKDAIWLFLAEASEPSPLRAKLDKEEKQARADLANAENVLITYDKQLDIKRQRDEKLKALGLTPKSTANKAKEIKNDSQYLYNRDLLQKKRTSLVADIEAAKARLAYYDSSTIDFKYPKKSKRTSPSPKIPEAGTKVMVDKNKIVYAQWYKWVPGVDNIKYKGSSSEEKNENTDDEDDEKDTGPGEKKAAAMYAGKAQGPSFDYDIHTIFDERFEVKALEKKNENIKPGKHGRIVYNKAWNKLQLIFTQLDAFYNACVDAMAHETGDKLDWNVIEHVGDFYDDWNQSVASAGEVSGKALKAIRNVLRAISSFIERNGPNSDRWTHVNTSVVHDDEVIRFSLLDFARFVKANGTQKQKERYKGFELAISELKDEIFWRPDAYASYLDELYGSIDVNKVFGHVDGLFIVNPAGWMLIPKGMYDSVLEFVLVSQGAPRFALKAWGGGPASAINPPLAIES